MDGMVVGLSWRSPEPKEAAWCAMPVCRTGCDGTGTDGGTPAEKT